MEPAQTKEMTGYQKMNHLIYEMFYTNYVVTAKQMIRTEAQITNKEKTKKINIEN